MSHEVQLSPTASFLPLPARRRRFRRSSHSAAPLPQRAGDTLIWPLPGRIGLYGAASLSHRSAVMSRKWGRDRRGRELGRNCRRRILDGGRARRGAGGERSSSRQQRDLRMVSGWAKRWPRTSAMSSCSTGGMSCALGQLPGAYTQCNVPRLHVPMRMARPRVSEPTFDDKTNQYERRAQSSGSDHVRGF